MKFFNEHIKTSIKHLNNQLLCKDNIIVQRSLRQPKNILAFLNTQTEFFVKKCLRPRCKTCNIIIEARKNIKIGTQFCTFNTNMNCTSSNVIYLLRCNVCSEFYIGQTTQKLSERMNLHRQHILNEHTSFLYVSFHIRNCGYNFSVIPLFKSNNSSSYILLHMESYFITVLKPTLNRDFT